MHLSRFLPLVLVLSTTTLPAADWPAFRGPHGDGVAELRADPPVQWSAEQNVKWKVPLPRPGNGSPIVFGDRVFVTSAEDEQGRRRSLYCFDRASGKQLWVRTVDYDRDEPTHRTNQYAGTTPATDGQRVVVWHGSAGLHCYDVDGRKLWSRDLGEFRHMWGYGTSPVIHGNRVILYTGPGAKIFVTALDLASGETVWTTEEPQEGDGEYNEDEKYMGSWSTPVVVEHAGREQVIVVLPTRVVSYDPETGKPIWTCDGIRGPDGDLAYSSPMVNNGICVVVGGFKGPSLAVEIDGRGDVTDTHRLWRNPENPQNIGSGVFVGKHVYLAHAGPGTLECIDALTGERQWVDRAEGANHWASIVAAGDRLYATNQDGTTVVFQPNPEKFERLAVNELGEASNSTPAVADKQIVLRTNGHLWCIE